MSKHLLDHFAVQLDALKQQGNLRQFTHNRQRGAVISPLIIKRC